MLHAKDAIKIEQVEYGQTKRNGKIRTQKLYFFKCSVCGSEIKSQHQHLKKHSGKCVKCAQFNDPFRTTYNEMVKAAANRDITVTMSYEEFLPFTKIYKCHYCWSEIKWFPHTKSNMEDVKGSRAYKLDRMNNDLGYHKDNCVVCCFRCNSAKSNKFTYEEWFGMTAYFRNPASSSSVDPVPTLEESVP